MGEVYRPQCLIPFNECFLPSEAKREKNDEILTKIINAYLHATNHVSIFCIKNCELRDWMGLKYIFNTHVHVPIAMFTGDFKCRKNRNMVQMDNTHTQCKTCQY